jgi:transposase
MPELNSLGRSLAALEQDSTLIAVIDMGQSSWLVAGIVPGVERQPLKKLEANEAALLHSLERWRGEAAKVGRTIARCRCLRGRPRRVLAGALAARAASRRT